MRNALANVPKGHHTMVAAATRQAFLHTDAEAACQTWRHVADQLRPRWLKLAALMGSIARLIGAVLLEQNDEWLLQRRYMQIEGMAELTPPRSMPSPANFHP
jgi:putative transposase